MTHVLAREKMEELFPRVIPGVLNMYKQSPKDVLQITQGLHSMIDAGIKAGDQLLTVHFDSILLTIYPLVQRLPSFTEPSEMRAHNELLRCFEKLCQAFSDRLMAFLFLKMEAKDESLRIGTIAVLKHLINSCGVVLKDKRELIISGVRPLITDPSLKVRSALTQLIVALASHDYLSLEGGRILIKFIVEQCSIIIPAENADKKKRKARKS